MLEWGACKPFSWHKSFVCWILLLIPRSLFSLVPSWLLLFSRKVVHSSPFIRPMDSRLPQPTPAHLHPQHGLTTPPFTAFHSFKPHSESARQALQFPTKSSSYMSLCTNPSLEQMLHTARHQQLEAAHLPFYFLDFSACEHEAGIYLLFYFSFLTFSSHLILTISLRPRYWELGTRWTRQGEASINRGRPFFVSRGLSFFFVSASLVIPVSILPFRSFVLVWFWHGMAYSA